MGARINEDRVALARIARHVRDPRLTIASYQQSLDDKVGRMEAAEKVLLEKHRRRTTDLAQRLAFLHPRAVIARERSALERFEDRLKTQMRRSLDRRRESLGSFGARLDAMSPLKVLGRGYAIATNAQGRAVRHGKDAKPGEQVVIRVQDARVFAEVTAVEEVVP
jgi:exodeoxyribonuclease VII large subunit